MTDKMYRQMDKEDREMEEVMAKMILSSPSRSSSLSSAIFLRAK